jgi:hypothetical protein
MGTTTSISIKYVCVVSADEDFRLTLGKLLASTCDVTLCDDLDSMVGAAGGHERMIALVDSTLLRHCMGSTKRVIEQLISDRSLYLICLYPYQLDDELVEGAIEYKVDSIWMQRILGKETGVA